PDTEAAPDPEADHADPGGAKPASPTPAKSGIRTAMIMGLTVIVALGGLGGWLGYRAYQSQQAEQKRNLFLQVGRQGALNLTTIDYSHADADIQRILDSATGTFHDDFQRRSSAFVEVLKKAQSKTEGAITEAGLESVSGDSARVLVAVSVKTSSLGATDQQPRNWRLRIDVQKVGDGAKVSNVGFVP
ncbi:MAG TPA: tetratricopeptide repeat protein, partial [Mycobacterium sp.]|nr:tetratricopeptide repeat protein [Mycobacterium sp.]